MGKVVQREMNGYTCLSIACSLFLGDSDTWKYADCQLQHTPPAVLTVEVMALRFALAWLGDTHDKENLSGFAHVSLVIPFLKDG